MAKRKPRPTRRPIRRSAARPKPTLRSHRKPRTTAPSKAKTRSPKIPARPKPSTSPTPAHLRPPTPVGDPTEGTPQWEAYELLIQKIESTYAPLAEIHRQLDEDHLEGQRFTVLLQRVASLWAIPLFYAGVVVRTYPGYKAVDAESTILQRFYRKWSAKKRRAFRPQPGLHTNPEDIPPNVL